MAVLWEHRGGVTRALGRMGEERGGEEVWGPEELRSHGKSEVYLLYWYKSTNTDAEGLLFWYKSTNTDAEELCLPGRFHFLELGDSTRMEILVFLEGCFCVTFSSVCDCMGQSCLPSQAKPNQATSPYF